MKFYLELTLLPNVEVSIYFLWSKVFQQIHLGLVEIKNEQGRVPIGISFPEYVQGGKFSLLGSKLRLFANDEETLINFDIAKCLARLTDYVHYTSIRHVPEKIIGYACYQRKQPKTNKERLARRFASRADKHGENHAIALAAYNELESKTIPFPFINLKSLSTETQFCLWLNKVQVDDLTQKNGFSSYGLSATDSVPEF